MPVRALVLVLVLGACRAPADGTDPRDPVAAHSDDVHDTDAHTDVPRMPLRPLCEEAAGEATVAADVAAWSEGLLTSPYYGESELERLAGLEGDALGATPDEAIATLTRRSWHALRLGHVDDAIADAQDAVDRAVATGSPLRGSARKQLAVAWMRRAEIENCVDGTGESCLVPFSDEAIHQRTEGMEHAAAALEALLEEDDPDALLPRWLLNLTQMALGAYPDGVDPRWRVDPALLASEAEVPPWHDVAPSLFGVGQGLRSARLAGGAAIEDFDGDGVLDLMISSAHPGEGMSLHLGTGDGFCDATAAAGLSGILGVLSFTQADMDNDGDLDVVAPRGAWTRTYGLARVSLLRNDGEGRFTDVAVEAGLGDVVGPSQASAWADVNGDGWVDLFVGREATSDVDAPSSLYLNQADGTFRDVTEAYGLLDLGWVKGAAWADYDVDGDPDLYVSVTDGPNRLFRNDGWPPFEDVSERQGVTEPSKGFATWWFDFDQDGDPDLFAAAYPTAYFGSGEGSDAPDPDGSPYVTGLLGLPSDLPTAIVYENTGRRFVDVTAELGLDDLHQTMGANTGDLDADGFPDVYLGTGGPEYDQLEPNTAYRNLRGRGFADVTTAAHLGHLQKGHGIAFGDLDEDGDEDLLSNLGGAYPGDGFPDGLYLNPTPDPHAVTLRLVGTHANRAAIGARIRIDTPEGSFHQVVGSGGSFGANSLQVEAGLGDATRIDRVEIAWPGGAAETVTGVEPGTVVTIREGEGVVEARPYGRLAFVLHEADEGHAGHEP